MTSKKSVLEKVLSAIARGINTQPRVVSSLGLSNPHVNGALHRLMKEHKISREADGRSFVYRRVR